MTETRESLTRTFCALCHAAMGVASEPACEDVLVVLGQKIEKTARALRDLRPVAKAGQFSSVACNGECVCGHSKRQHEGGSFGEPFKCAGGDDHGDDHPKCQCPEYRPLPF